MNRLFQLTSYLLFLTSTAQAVVTSTGNIDPGDPTTWNNSTTAYVGKATEGTLTINSESIISQSGYLGYDSNVLGAVSISGINSIWSFTKKTDLLSPVHDSLYIGYEGIGTLQIDNGGQVHCNGNGHIGYASGSTGSVTVDGVGSRWELCNSPYGPVTIVQNIYVGNQGTGTLLIKNGGEVYHEGNGYVGYTSGSTGMVTVEGDGSAWNTDSNLAIGYNGMGTFNITDGGRVEVQKITMVSGPLGNEGTLHLDNGTLVTGALFASSIDCFTGIGTIDTNGLILDGIDLCFDSILRLSPTLVIHHEDPGQKVVIDIHVNGQGAIGAGYAGNGTLTINNGVEVPSSNGYLGYRSGSTGTATVSGTDSTWTNSEFLYVGYEGTGELDVTDKATVNCKRGYIGSQAGSSGTVTVSGIGSTWNSPAALMVGCAGDGTLNITEGGTLNNDPPDNYSSSYLGYETEATGTVNVSGVGSTWNGCASLIGWFGHGELNVTNGATVNNRHGGFLGVQDGSTGIATISGTNSTWNIDNELVIGLSGNGTLNITDGGMVNVASYTNLTINGGDATAKIHFDNGTLTTGSLLAGANQLSGVGTINTNGLVADGIDLVFDADHGLQHSQTMAGTDKNITFNIDCDQPVYMGAGYTGTGTLTIRDGLTVSSQHGHLGYQTGSSGTATVSGTNSMWELASPNYGGCDLYVGYRGTGQLNITNGGTVSVQDETLVAYMDGSSGAIHFDRGILNTAALCAGSDQLTGTGIINTNGLIADGFDLVFDQEHGLQQTFTLSGPDKNITVNLNQLDTETLGAGYTGHGTLTVRDGIVVKSSDSYSTPSCLGYHTGSAGIATVTGPGSKWIQHSLKIGYYGSGELNIDDGGKVVSDSASIGSQPGSNGTVIVSGTDSTWITDKLYIGMQGTGELRILDGGTVSSASVFVGSSAGSSGTVTVSGPGSTWEMDSSQDLCIFIFGLQGTGTLDIKNGGLIKVDSTLYLGFYEDQNNYINMTTGGMLALRGEKDESLDDFFTLINSTDAIRWWDDSIDDWAPLTMATIDVDYTLQYMTDGDLAGYTLLTVGVVPEPGCVVLFLTALFAAGNFIALRSTGPAPLSDEGEFRHNQNGRGARRDTSG